MAGEEASLFVSATASRTPCCPPRRTTSASCDGDSGPNTGGMGAYAPAPVLTPRLLHQSPAAPSSSPRSAR